ncbi:MAG: zf-TFIIB domain-containing protein, partial [Candidatus Pacebacteria bacterium]|nr:zf-TFIIB domain-containing protein [Candidatus Paceibacterota bacterium]
NIVGDRYGVSWCRDCVNGNNPCVLMMKCPNCSTNMHSVQTQSHLGIHIMLDQCPTCGGLWFEGRELYRVKHGEAQQIASGVPLINKEKLRENVVVKKKLFCPKDGQKLDVFFDPVFPKEIEVERCSVCGGFWFNRGEFMKFQMWRKKKRKEHEKNELSPEMEEKVNALLVSHSNQKTYKAMQRLGTYLNQPIEKGFDDASRTTEDTTSRKAKDIIMTVLYILLRLLLRR